MNDTLRTLMREATRLTQTGRLNEATQALQRALAGQGLATPAPTPNIDASMVLDGCVFETQAGSDERTAEAPGPQPSGAANADKGSFTAASHSHAGLTRRYKLYVPPRSAGPVTALVVMLHGCTQNADDFSAGTNMN